MTSNDLGNFHPFHSTMSRFLVMLLLFKQGTLNDPKWPWHVQYQKRRPFRSTMSRFRVVTQFCEKSTKWPENDTCSHVQGQKYPYAFNIYLKGPKITSVSLYDEHFQVMSSYIFFRKVHRKTPNNLNMSKVKDTNIDATYTPEGQFLSVSFYNEPFLSYEPILWKVHSMTP